MSMTIAEREVVLVQAENDVLEAAVSLRLDKRGSLQAGWFDVIMQILQSIMSACGVANSVERAKHRLLARLLVSGHLADNPQLLDDLPAGLTRFNAVSMVCEVGRSATVEKANQVQQALSV